MRACITGGAGFIGSNLADELHRRGWTVVVLDDFRSGRREFLSNLMGQPGFTLVEGDVLDDEALHEAIAGSDWVFHLQANADVRRGLDHPTKDLEQNTIATSRVLEAMRLNGVRRILFSSTGSVYGEPQVFPTAEDAPFPIQTSLYGASKLAGEGLLAAYAQGYGMTSVICRFVSVLGERYTHGHVFDFFVSLRRDPSSLVVLGDGHQEKSYMYIKDCVEAMLATVEAHNDDGVFVYNLGTDATFTVNDSLKVICRHLSVQPELKYTGGSRGWVGDSPLIRLDIRRIRSLGWEPEVSIPDALVRTLDWLEGNEYVWRDLVGTDSRPGASSCP